MYCESMTTVIFMAGALLGACALLIALALMGGR